VSATYSQQKYLHGTEKKNHLQKTVNWKRNFQKIYYSKKKVAKKYFFYSFI